MAIDQLRFAPRSLNDSPIDLSATPTHISMFVGNDADIIEVAWDELESFIDAMRKLRELSENEIPF